VSRAAACFLGLAHKVRKLPQRELILLCTVGPAWPLPVAMLLNWCDELHLLIEILGDKNPAVAGSFIGVAEGGGGGGGGQPFRPIILALRFLCS